MIHFRCPTCQQQIQAQDDIAGAKVRCPKCSQKLVVPSAVKPASRNKSVLRQSERLNKTILGESEPLVSSTSSITPSAAAARSGSLLSATDAVDETSSVAFNRSKGWRYLSLPWLISLFIFGFLPWCEISCNGNRNGIVPRVTQSGYQALYGGYSTPFPSIVEDEIHKMIAEENKIDKRKLQKQIELDRSYLTNVSPFLTVFWGAGLALAGVVCFVPLGRPRLSFTSIVCGLLLVVLVVHIFLGLPLERRLELSLAQAFRDDPDKTLLGLMVVKIGKTPWFWLVLTGVALLAATESILNLFKAERWVSQPRDWITPGIITCLGLGLTLVGGISQFAVYKHELNWEENQLASYNKAEMDKQRRFEEERLAAIRRREAEMELQRQKQMIALEEQKQRAENQRRLREQEAEERRRQRQKEQDDLNDLMERRKVEAEATRKADAERRAEQSRVDAERRAKQERIDSEEIKAKKLLRAALLLDTRSGFDDQVRQRLKEIIEKYPDTPSAAKAKEKLKKLEEKNTRAEEAKNDDSSALRSDDLKRTAHMEVEVRLRADEAELRKQLLNVPELRLVNDLEVQALHKSTDGKSAMAALHQVLVKSGIQAGLPLRDGVQARLQPSAAMVVEQLSKSLRDLGFVSGVPSPASRRRLSRGQENKPLDKVVEFQKWCDESQIEKANAALPTLLQMLQVEEPPLRLLLARELAKVKNRDATIVLTSRALFDLDPEVRDLAVKSLEGRSTNQYLPFLLKALRYPWPPVADHAALALRKLKTTGIEPQLLKMLEHPNPAVPAFDKKTKKLLVPELVRLNHMRNCVLCHAPSADAKDGLVRGVVPIPGQPLPPLYYASGSGNFVRADTTFLRQDFSVIMPVEGAKPWPAEQRFDFVVRIRVVKPDEMPEIAAKPENNYPQREAVLYALRGITGKDAGESAEKWREMLGIIKENTQEPNQSRNRSP
ncbi:MAG: HEAT repeat domain-containing protein [Gemmataceae bacterium]